MMFEELKVDPSYEIAKDQYPYIIRKKGKSKPIKASCNTTGYLQIRLGGKMYCLHKVIAEQYLDNPNNYNEVDHIDHDKSNNRVENLRWCSKSENQRNKSSYNDKIINCEKVRKTSLFPKKIAKKLWEILTCLSRLRPIRKF